ncbi:uncharacterized protein ACNLHF_007713 [Anomaloglossus baeobatrachus]|uniref:uncharacterized protein LOC142254811 n=1 Tax=Anomaloglossus baeobatrachus TaxID=238106 RepID=UPI003F50B7EC
MSQELGSSFNAGDIIEILHPGHRHWAIYIGDGNIVHLTGTIVGAGDDSVHGNSVVVEKTNLEDAAKGSGFRVTNLYNGEVMPIPNDEVVSSALRTVGESKPYGICCQNFVLELKYGSANLDIIIRNLMPIPGEITVAAAKGVKILGSTISSNSDIVGSIAAKGVDLAGQGLTAVSDAVGTAAGKGVAVLGNMLSMGAQTLAPVIAAKVDAISAGSGSMVLAAADSIAPLAETLAAQSGSAEEATARSITQLGSSVSSSSSAVGSAVSTGLSWLGSASAAGASSLLGYFRSPAETPNEADKISSVPEDCEKDTCNEQKQ